MILRQTTLIGSVAIILVLVIGSTIYLEPQLVQFNNSAPVLTVTGSKTAARTTDSDLGLELIVSQNVSSFQSGTAINLSLTVTNARAEFNNVSGSSNWPWNVDWKFSVSPCPASDSWGTFAIFKGYFTTGNLSFSSSDGVYSSPPGVAPSCPIGTFPLFVMHPSSDSTNISTTTPPNYDMPFGLYNLTETFSLSGYYTTAQGYVTSNSILPPPPYPPGIYTAVAGDEWGQILVLHFTVL